LTTEASSHGSGPPILSINDKLADNNPIFVSSTNEIALGSDKAPENYLTGSSIKFSLVMENLPAPKEVVDRSTFYWDFGDGTKKDGLSVTHSYTNPGTYIVKMTVKDPTQNATFDLNTAQINLLPSLDYSLPTAKIKIEGKLISDPIKDTLTIKKGDTLEFDASESSGENLSFVWDFGDGQSAQGAKVKHTFNNDFFPIFPLLRVTDKNNLASDTFAEIFSEEGGQGTFPNPNYKTPPESTQASSKSSRFNWPTFLGLALTSTALVSLIYLKFFRKKAT